MALELPWVKETKSSEIDSPHCATMAPTGQAPGKLKTETCRAVEFHGVRDCTVGLEEAH